MSTGNMQEGSASQRITAEEALKLMEAMGEDRFKKWFRAYRRGEVGVSPAELLRLLDVLGEEDFGHIDIAGCGDGGETRERHPPNAQRRRPPIVADRASTTTATAGNRSLAESVTKTRWTRTERRRLYEWLVKSAKRSLGVSQLASVARDDLGLEGRSVMAIACQIRMVRSMSMDAVQEWIAQGH